MASSLPFPRLTFTVVVISVCLTVVSALTPYRSSYHVGLSEPESGKYPGETCDSPCFHNRNSLPGLQHNITFLCGSDGFTYLNFDEFNCVRKRCGKDITLRQLGRCPRHVSLSTPLSFPEIPQQQQTKSYNRLDKNFLRFLSQQSAFSQGPIVFPETPKIAQNNVNSVPRNFNYWQARPVSRGHKKICLPAECNCSDDIFQPVCGSDSVTYGNQCLMECSKECKPDLVKFHDGYCGKSFQSYDNCALNQCQCSGEEYEDNGLQLRHPVCGSDGVTYSSMCLLECNRTCKPDLQVNHAGYCGRLTYPSK